MHLISLAAERHLQQIIDNMHETKSDDELIPYPEVSRLQFIICQLQNSLVPKNRRRYNVLTQILSLKTHLISPVSSEYVLFISSAPQYIVKVVFFLWS